MSTPAHASAKMARVSRADLPLIRRAARGRAVCCMGTILGPRGYTDRRMPKARPREVAIEIVRTLRDGGHVAYFAGGCVRDELLARAPKDYDVATEAPPERVASLFRRTREVGRAFGVMLVSISDVTVEVSTFRREHGYSDKRRPDAVTYCDAESDAHRRDFTINALFIDPLDVSDGPGGKVIDFAGGLADLRAGVVRAVGDPERRLAEDHLRALRAVRFAARLAFRIEDATAGAIRRHARELEGVSRERIGDELRLMISDPRRAEALRLIETMELDAPALSEPARDPGARGDLPSVALLPERHVRFGLGLAAWAIDRHGRGRSGEEVAREASGIADRWRRALCLSNEETDELRSTLTGVGVLESQWPGLTKARRKRAAASGWFAGAKGLARARRPEVCSRIEAEVEALGAEPGGLAPPPFVTGDDLIAAGLTPGPRFGKWLEDAYDAQLEGRISGRGEALALVKSWAEAK